jgi:hypothetical protein
VVQVEVEVNVPYTVKYAMATYPTSLRVQNQAVVALKAMLIGEGRAEG